jgi:hypothetical protein
MQQKWRAVTSDTEASPLLSPLLLILLHSDGGWEPCCELPHGEAYVARNCRSLVSSQGGTEALGPVTHKELNPDEQDQERTPLPRHIHTPCTLHQSTCSPTEPWLSCEMPRWQAKPHIGVSWLICDVVQVTNAAPAILIDRHLQFYTLHYPSLILTGKNSLLTRHWGNSNLLWANLQTWRTKEFSID